MANGLFDNLGSGLEKFFLGDEPRLAREKEQETARLLERKQKLAEDRFLAEQSTAQRGVGNAQFERLQKLIKDADLTPQAREDIGRRLSQSPQLKGFQREGGASLFSFAEPVKSVADQRAAAVAKLPTDQRQKVLLPELTPEEKKLGNIQVVQDPNNPGSFIKAELTVDENGKIQLQSLGAAPESATKAPSTNINVSTGMTREQLEKTVRSKTQLDVIELNDQIKEIQDLGENFETEFLTTGGALRAGASSKLEKFLNIPPATTEKALEKLGLVDKADKDFLTRRTSFLLPAYTILNERIKEITGAAVRKGEEGRLGQSTVDPTKDSPTQFRAKRQAVEDILLRQRKEKLILLARGLEYNTENVESIPIDNVDSLFKQEVLGEQLTTGQELQNQVNTVKQSGEQGNATVANAPSAKTQPQELSDQLQFSDISKQLPAGTLEPFMTSHPQSLQVMQQLLAEEQMEIGDIGDFLKLLGGLSDEQVIQRLQGMRGSQ
jgi:hypothetical protein